MWSRLRPDLVALEQPYAWPSLRGLLKEGAVERPVIVYSGQNVESELKREVYQAVLPPVESAAALTRVRELEEDLIRDADVCVAVSASDAERYAQVGARRLIVARNGGDRVIAPPAAVARWRDRLAALGKSRYAAFVGSAHPPNCAGFVKMLGPALGYLPPDAAIVVAGRVAEMIGRSDFCAGRYGALNRGRLLLAGPVSDDDLAGLMAGASAVLLPIISGGGSNLKTVEALLSGRPVVGTRYAFRSYEDCITAGGVLAADEAAEFQRHVARALLSPGAGGPPPSRFDELTWPHIGRAYVRELLALVESGAAAGGRGP
jgi:glycosyltransferase involved in cell wall biosynthesis